MAIKVDIGSQTISWFNDRLSENRLEFKPPFQRNPVWLDKHKSYLIDTVLRGLPIPEVYIQKQTDAAGKTNYAVVDGQQRLRTLLSFPDGNMELMENYSPGRGGQTWEDLDDDTEKIAFWSYKLSVREVENATDAELRDLFRRLNQHTVVLNAQEIRNARFKGDFISTVTELANESFWSERRVVTPNEIRRMVDIEYMAELLVGIMHGPQNKKATLDGLFASYEDRVPNKQAWLKRFEAARELTELVVPDLQTTRWRGKSDYYSLFLALAALSEEGNLGRTKRGAAATALRKFGEQVTARLSKDTPKTRVSKDIVRYVSAVEKAASDKDRRQTRHEILTKLLKPFFVA